MQVSFLGFLSLPTQASIKAGSDILLKAMPMLLYIHYSILSFDASDERTLRERFLTVTGLGDVIDAYRENTAGREYISALRSSRRFLITMLLIFSAYLAHNYLYFNVLDNPNMRKLTSIYFAERENIFLVELNGLHKINVYGNFSDGSEYRITEPTFGTRYSSSNPVVAKISKECKLLTLSAGEAVITAKNRGLTAQWHVKVVYDYSSYPNY
jgi:hypothetical protein